VIARVLLVVLAADGGTLSAPGRTPDWSAPIYSECNERWPADAGYAVEQPDGQWLYPKARNARVACLMATCDVRRQDDEHEAPPLSSTSITFSMITFAAGLILGGTLVGWAAWQLRALFP